MPGPAFVTRTVTLPPPDPPLTRTSGVRRERTSPRSRAGSRTRARAGRRRRGPAARSAGRSSSIGRSPNRGRDLPRRRVRRRRRDRTSRSADSTAPASIRDRSRRSSTIRARRSDSASMAPRRASRSSPARLACRRPLAAVVIAVSGERRSWEIACRRAVFGGISAARRLRGRRPLGQSLALAGEVDESGQCLREPLEALRGPSPRPAARRANRDARRGCERRARPRWSPGRPRASARTGRGPAPAIADSLQLGLDALAGQHRGRRLRDDHRLALAG